MANRCSVGACSCDSRLEERWPRDLARQHSLRGFQSRSRGRFCLSDCLLSSRGFRVIFWEKYFLEKLITKKLDLLWEVSLIICWFISMIWRTNFNSRIFYFSVEYIHHFQIRILKISIQFCSYMKNKDVARLQQLLNSLPSRETVELAKRQSQAEMQDDSDEEMDGMEGIEEDDQDSGQLFLFILLKFWSVLKMKRFLFLWNRQKRLQYVWFQNHVWKDLCFRKIFTVIGNFYVRFLVHSMIIFLT